MTITEHPTIGEQSTTVEQLPVIDGMTPPEWTALHWVDFHTHILDSPSLEEDAMASQQAGVSRWLVNSVSLNSWNAFNAIGKKYPPALIGLGWHPEEVIRENPARIDSVLESVSLLVKNAPYLGETGLDFLYGDTVEKQSLQKKVFQQFLDWSKSHDKLIIVHTRHAKQEALDMIDASGCKKVILHWFNGNAKQLDLIAQRNWVVTVGPTILNSPHVDKTIHALPLEQIGLETDSPIPFDGKQSTPAWIPLVARRVAELKQVTLSEVNDAQRGIFSRFFPAVDINPLGMSDYT